MTKHHEQPMGHCLGCIPIRTGVILYSSFVLLLSVCAVASLVTEDTRFLVGGYTYWSGVAVNILGCFGLAFALMSLIGLDDNHSSWVRCFAHYALVRVLLRCWIFWVDYAALRGCEKMGLSSMNGPYNPAMTTVYLDNRCHSARYFNFVWSFVDIFLSMYGVWNTYSWCYAAEHGPMYHITLDDSKPLRFYTGYSTVGHPDPPLTVQVVPPHTPPAQSGAAAGARSSTHLAPPPPSYGGTNQDMGSAAAIPL